MVGLETQDPQEPPELPWFIQWKNVSNEVAWETKPLASTYILAFTYRARGYTYMLSAPHDFLKKEICFSQFWRLGGL